MKRILFISLGLFLMFSNVQGQVLRDLQNRIPTGGGAGGFGGQQRSGGGGKEGGRDSLIVPQKREVIHLNLSYRKMDDILNKKLDSSIDDFNRFLPDPADYVNLGNLGTPSNPLIYKPQLYTGFDAGFHALDIYRLDVDSTRFYDTNHPYSTLQYLMGPQQEQMLGVLVTENLKPNLNIGFQFRKINAPGTFKSQNTDDNNLNIFGHFSSKMGRYNAYLSIVSNKLHTGESGGLVNEADLEDPLYSDSRTLPVHLGGSSGGSSGLFSSRIATQSNLLESDILLRQQYDWGTSDSIMVNDSTKKYLYYPVLRIEHTLKILNQKSGFSDTTAASASDYYEEHYGLDPNFITRIEAAHDWKTLSNDFSIIQYPSKKNLAQFLKLGATYDNVSGHFLDNSIEMNYLKGHAEYHNLTRNRKWNLDANGEFIFGGESIGNFLAHASISRFLNEKLGNIKLSFMNLNQTPSFVYRFFESNQFLSTNNHLNATNITRLQFASDNKALQYRLEANYFLITNYTYFKNFYESAQNGSPFNLLQVILSKKFTKNHFNWYLDLALQQTTGSNGLNIPQFWTRNRFTYENVLFKNLNLNTGLEVRYHTPYHADYYSPVLQQFITQNDRTIQDKIPNIAAFVHLRIKAFTAYVRAENLNTYLGTNIIETPSYPYPGFLVRLGIDWTFLN